MAARIDEPAIVMLAMQFDKMRRYLAEQSNTDALVVDKGLASAVTFQLPPEDQRLARLDLHFGVVEHRADRFGQPGEFEAGGHTRLFLTRAHQ